ncbi:MAG: beta-hydroxyacyl-ACP dehydratase [Planctomycetaceae bacterium]|nr:beta-hydroxyacyl-ACP dehydratase [Planctomycetaceae bacterium]
MAPKFLVDLSKIDLNEIRFDQQQIEQVNPQRGHMRHLDGIIWTDEENTQAVGFKDVRADEFWVDGHIPGRPLFPGVLMIEAGAQLAAFIMKQHLEDASTFIGFIGCDKVKFRGQVVPGQRLLLVGRVRKFSARRVVCEMQGVVDGTLVIEATITGMPI